MSAEHADYEEKVMTEPDNVNVGLVATVSVVGAILTLSIVLALTALVRSEAAAHSGAVGAHADLGTVARLKDGQRAKLSEGPRWVDKAKGAVALPIDQAMDLVQSEIRQNPARATKASAAEPEALASPDGGAAGDGGASSASDE
jgi:hypothetical protein